VATVIGEQGVCGQECVVGEGCQSRGIRQLERDDRSGGGGE
jgi:hypothetical protein